MTKSLKLALAAAATLGSVATIAAPASAMPLSPSVTTARSADVQDVRFVCGPYRCFHRPGFFRPGFVGPRFGYGPRFRYGYRRW